MRIPCPICGEREFRKRFTKKGRDFWRCPDCAVELQHPLPTEDELRDYYDRSYADGMYNEFAAAAEMKRMTAEQRLREVRRTLEVTGRWLDVGASNGTFVRAANDAGAAAEGVELSQVAVDRAREEGVDLHCGPLDSLPTDPGFDVITGFDVLEHVLDPITFLNDIRTRLNPGGHVVLTLPDTGTLVRRAMGSRWYFYIPEEHLHYFNRRNLAELLRRQGFAPVRAGATYKPLTFDYSQTQFQEYNPLIYQTLRVVGAVLPKSLRSKILPLPIGEMMVIAKRVD